MDTTSDLFESYEADYLQLLQAIQLTLNQHPSATDIQAKNALLRRVGMQLEEADEIVSQMDIELHTLDGQDRGRMLSKVKGFKSELLRTKSDLKQLIASTDRDDLLFAPGHMAISIPSRSDSTSPSYGAAQASRTRLLSATDKLTDGQRRLEDSHRVALETEVVGSGILNDLRSQRETLVHTRDNLYTADGSIDRASSSLNKMVRRMYQQRAVTYAIMAILILLILFVLYSKILN